MENHPSDHPEHERKHQKKQNNLLREHQNFISFNEQSLDKIHVENNEQNRQQVHTNNICDVEGFQEIYNHVA